MYHIKNKLPNTKTAIKHQNQKKTNCEKKLLR